MEAVKNLIKNVLEVHPPLLISLFPVEANHQLTEDGKKVPTRGPKAKAKSPQEGSILDHMSFCLLPFPLMSLQVSVDNVETQPPNDPGTDSHPRGDDYKDWLESNEGGGEVAPSKVVPHMDDECEGEGEEEEAAEVDREVEVEDIPLTQRSPVEIASEEEKEKDAQKDCTWIDSIWSDSSGPEASHLPTPSGPCYLDEGG